jgi:processive 1,2-diacylglycerol beta-glucosyltransferase
MMADQKPTIVLLSATAGFGHVKAGKSLALALTKRFPEWTIIHENIGDFSTPFLRNLTEKGWLFLSTTPVFREIYSFMHRRVISSDRLCRLIAPAFYEIGRRLSSLYGERDVRAVIALHPAAAAAAIAWKKQKRFLVAVVATDLVVHGLQTLPGIDLVFSDPGALFVSRSGAEMRSCGKVVFSGLPVERKFFCTEDSRVSRHDKIVVSFGGLGLRGARNIRKLIAIISLQKEFRFTIICGRNPSLRQKMLRAVCDAGLKERVSVLGFVENMKEELVDAYMFIGKPGGISIGEALALDIPIGVIDVLPGQEEANIEALRSMARRVILIEPHELEGSRLSLMDRTQAVQLLRPKSGSVGGIDAIVSHLDLALGVQDRTPLLRRAGSTRDV